MMVSRPDERVTGLVYRDPPTSLLEVPQIRGETPTWTGEGNPLSHPISTV